MFSRFRPDSELNRVNRARGSVVQVSAPFAEMLELALRAARQTDGLVDPTLGAAIEAAGYDRDFSELTPVRGPRGARRARTVALRPPAPDASCTGRAASCLDLNGVVKGKTVDDALALIDGDGFVSAGGDLAARGAVDVALPGRRRGARARQAVSPRAARRSGAGCARARGSTI